MKIIPAIDIMEGKVVRLVKGDPKNKIIYNDEPVETALKFQEQGADMIHIVDLDAALSTGWNNNQNNQDIISKIIDTIEIPTQIAGGIRNIQAIDRMLKLNVLKKTLTCVVMVIR